jgi:hypothetical protein
MLRAALVRSRHPNLFAGFVLAIGLMASQLACVSGTSRIVRAAVPAGIDEALGAFDDHDNQKLLLRLANDPELSAAAHSLAATLARGALDGITDEAHARELEVLSESYVRTVSAALAQELDQEISPAATRSVQRIVGGAIASAMSSKQERRTSSFVDGVTRTAVAALMQSTGQGLRDDLGPALGAVIREDLGPALRAAIHDDLQPALRELLGSQDDAAASRLVRQLAKDAVLGANDGMSELGISPSPNREDGMGLFGWVTVVLGLVVAILLLLLVRTILRHRALEQDRVHLEQERLRSERTLLTILRTLQTAEDRSHPPDLRTLIERARMYDDIGPGQDQWWNSILTRARIIDKPDASGGAPSGAPPHEQPGSPGSASGMG